MKKLNEYFNLNSDCFFSSFSNPVWAKEFPNAAELDLYFLTHYGARLGFETVLDIYADSSTGKISGQNLAQLSSMIYNVNKRKWDHLFAVYESEYDPIENTNVYEEVNEDNTLNRVIDSDKTDSSSLTSSTGTTESSTSSENAGRYGFNSSSAVGDKTLSGSTSGSSTVSVSNSSSGSNTDDTTINDTEDKNLIRHKHGNIGVTENTTMLEHEVQFWKWSFIDSVCMDICDIIALSIY